MYDVSRLFKRMMFPSRNKLKNMSILQLVCNFFYILFVRRNVVGITTLTTVLSRSKFSNINCMVPRALMQRTMPSPLLFGPRASMLILHKLYLDAPDVSPLESSFHEFLAY